MIVGSVNTSEPTSGPRRPPRLEVNRDGNGRALFVQTQTQDSGAPPASGRDPWSRRATTGRQNRGLRDTCRQPRSSLFVAFEGTDVVGNQRLGTAEPVAEAVDDIGLLDD